MWVGVFEQGMCAGTTNETVGRGMNSPEYINANSPRAMLDRLVEMGVLEKRPTWGGNTYQVNPDRLEDEE